MKFFLYIIVPGEIRLNSSPKLKACRLDGNPVTAEALSGSIRRNNASHVAEQFQRKLSSRLEYSNKIQISSMIH